MENMENMNETLEATEVIADETAETARKIGYKQIGIAGAILLGSVVLTKKVLIPGVKKGWNWIKAKKAAKKAAKTEGKQDFDIENMEIQDLPDVE